MHHTLAIYAIFIWSVINIAAVKEYNYDKRSVYINFSLVNIRKIILINTEIIKYKRINNSILFPSFQIRPCFRDFPSKGYGIYADDADIIADLRV